MAASHDLTRRILCARREHARAGPSLSRVHARLSRCIFPCTLYTEVKNRISRCFLPLNLVFSKTTKNPTVTVVLFLFFYFFGNIWLIHVFYYLTHLRSLSLIATLTLYHECLYFWRESNENCMHRHLPQKQKSNLSVYN